jgi:2-oxoglutarate ferredoxin oxidoreductase subunit beta
MKFDVKENIDIAWCPGCGNFPIRKTLIEALEELGMTKKEAVVVAGIGQAAKMPQYLDVNAFSGLHGRAMAVAFGIKASNPSLKVIVEGGDGDMYAEGGNHFLHNIRRNIDVAHLVHNNMVYGLTKGQASPTSREGFETPLQVDGVILEPFNPLTIALSAGATFVARAFSSDVDKTKDIIKAAINHKGYALVDIFQPCVSFNKVNTNKWYKENSYYLEEDYDHTSFENAYKKASEIEKFPLGILYKKEKENSYTENHNVYLNNREPVIKRKRDIKKVNKLINS